MNKRSKIKKTQTSFSPSENSDNQSGPLVASNDDLLTEILLRLPVTSILRFKSVSKHWHSLLTHTRFTHRFDNLSKSPGLFAQGIYVPFNIQTPTPTTPPFRSLESYFHRRDVRIVQSCNGLLLCCIDKGYKGSLKYFVFNPTTKQLATIPSLPGRLTICFMGLAFHQTGCVHYKVVCIQALKPTDELFQIQIYSSDTAKWKVSIESFSADKPVFRDAVYWNGAVYWAPYYRNSNYLYFKIDVGQLLMLPLPEVSVSPEAFLGESRGRLYLVPFDNREGNGSCFDMYEMLSDHSGWFVKYRVQFGELPRAFPDMKCPYGYDFSVLDVVRGEEEEDTFVVLITPLRIITYNVCDKSFKEIFRLKRHFFGDCSRFNRYTETLTSF